MNDFKLDKWYFDCVSPDTAVLIGYAARLRWGPLALSYGARITRTADGRVTQRQRPSFGRVQEEDDATSWSNDALGVAGRWSGGRALDPVVLVDEPSGSIEWECLTANGDVAVTVDGQPMTGSGYAERISMTLPPWRLPFRELRWGRYISRDGEAFAVWIDVRGEQTRNWVWMNDRVPGGGFVDEAGVRTADGELVFESSLPFRHERVTRSLLGRFEFLAALVPRGARGIQESKQLSSCTLTLAGSESTGYSINEVVRWL